MPFPNIGNILCGTNLLIFAKNKKTILANTIGRIIRLVFKVALKSNLLAIHKPIINSNIIN